MEPYANHPAGNSPAANSWTGQTTPAGFSQASSGWASQPGTPQPTPSWVGQSAALPVGVTPTQLDRKSSWPVLQLIARWLKIVAWVELVFSVLTAIGVGTAIGSIGAYAGGGAYAGSSGGGSGAGFFGLVLTIYLLVGAALGFMLTYGSAEMIQVFLTIEKNTRKSD